MCKKVAEQDKLCIECRPISNEILGLRPCVKDAVVYKLMDQKIPCGPATIRRCSGTTRTSAASTEKIVAHIHAAPRSAAIFIRS